MTMLETPETRKLKHGANGWLSFYRKNKFYIHALWVTEVTQPHQVNGTRAQSQHQAHWYPRSFHPGEMSITIRCRNQNDFQRLSNLARLHHRNMLETPGLRFSNKPHSTGIRHLLRFRLPSEAINVHGWIPSFTRTNQGVHVVAPEYTFTFFVAIDPLSTNPIVSHQIREWWNPAKMSPVGDPFAFDPDQGKPNTGGGSGQGIGDFGGVGGR